MCNSETLLWAQQQHSLVKNTLGDQQFTPHIILLTQRFSEFILTALKASIEDQMSFPRGSCVAWRAHHQFTDIPHQDILSSSFTAWREDAIQSREWAKFYLNELWGQ